MIVQVANLERQCRVLIIGLLTAKAFEEHEHARLFDNNEDD